MLYLLRHDGIVNIILLLLILLILFLSLLFPDFCQFSTICWDIFTYPRLFKCHDYYIPDIIFTRIIITGERWRVCMVEKKSRTRLENFKINTIIYMQKCLCVRVCVYVCECLCRRERFP